MQGSAIMYAMKQPSSEISPARCACRQVLWLALQREAERKRYSNAIRAIVQNVLRVPAEEKTRRGNSLNRAPTTDSAPCALRSARRRLASVSPLRCRIREAGTRPPSRRSNSQIEWKETVSSWTAFPGRSSNTVPKESP